MELFDRKEIKFNSLSLYFWLNEVKLWSGSIECALYTFQSVHEIKVHTSRFSKNIWMDFVTSLQTLLKWLSYSVRIHLISFTKRIAEKENKIWLSYLFDSAVTTGSRKIFWNMWYVCRRENRTCILKSRKTEYIANNSFLLLSIVNF